MKREGRQHGLVRTHKLIFSPDHPRPSNIRIANEVSGPAMAGSFVKAPSKPTNHSKFTSKYSWSHVLPVSKSKEKAKGNHKFRSFDGGFSGWSSEEALRCLGGDDDDDDDDDDDELVESGFDCGDDHSVVEGGVGDGEGLGEVGLEIVLGGLDDDCEEEDWCFV
ncbi:hypothetical protein QJS04_geneDACA004423 [Acorus gramineus]|uniref:Uncharacterized protein n=1 Tax=Acorus gramineus TaxID=55184 RepID=A0AAV9B4A7_ACOGR|nr:hypothetical protein QJS04_geneDACA004423 [Acorus gramineus]